MRQEVLIGSLHRRMIQRGNLLVVFLVGGMFCIFRVMAGGPEITLLDLALPFVLILAHLALSPIPWQWTGTDEPRVGLSRGFLQALIFNALWVGLVLVVMHAASPQSARERREPRRMEPPNQMEGLEPPPLPLDQTPRMEMAPPEMEVPPRSKPPFRPMIPGLGIGLLNVAFAIVVGWVISEKEAMEEKERQTADLLRQSQSKALLNQLEPHVLYNALSGLSELVYEDPLAAEDVITRLADLYRMLTVHGKADLVTLAQERRLVEAYLAMEQMRLGDRLRIHWDWPDWADDLRLPPYFLQPLVENAIKHGISPCDQGGEVVISCHREDDMVILKVENTGRALIQGSAKGVGLGNLEARLELWDGARGTFLLDGQGEWTVAAIRWRTVS